MHLPFWYGTTRNFCKVSSYGSQSFTITGDPVDYIDVDLAYKYAQIYLS